MLFRSTAAVSAGDGRPVDANYSNLWNGSTWTAGNNTSQYGYAAVGLGIQTAGMLAGRYDGGSQNYVETFNGTSWSSSAPDLNTARYNPQGSGTQTAALVFGGNLNPGFTAATEKYNGTSWTSNPTGLNTARDAGAGSGTQTDSVCYGGSGPTGATEVWNGTSWSNNPNSMSTARNSLNNTLGTGPATLAVGAGPANLSVESYAGPGVTQTKTVTVS